MIDRKLMLRIFALALSVRWGIALILYLVMGNDGLFGMDSRGYFGWISEHVERLLQGQVSGWHWLGPDSLLLPLPSLLWTLNGILFGQHAALSSVLCQGALDSCTCVLICRIAHEIDLRLVPFAGICAAFNPTQIVMANLYYNDAIFLFFFAVSLLGAVKWLKQPSWSSALLIGIGLGSALLCRVVIAPWALLMLVYFFAVMSLRRCVRLEHTIKLTVATVIVGLSASLPVGRNYSETGNWALTTQTGAHTAYWVVPLVMQAKDGIPWERGSREMARRFSERYGPEGDNRAVNSEHLSELAGEVLSELGPAAITKAWLIGAAMNLGSPVSAIFPPLAQLPRTGFFGTPGDSFSERVLNFLFHSDNAVFAWSILGGIVGLVVIRVVQLFGAITLLAQKRTRAITLLMMGWIMYVLLISGPVGSPKYRLPIEPVLVVFAAAGWIALRRRHLSVDGYAAHTSHPKS